MLSNSGTVYSKQHHPHGYMQCNMTNIAKPNTHSCWVVNQQTWTHQSVMFVCLYIFCSVYVVYIVINVWIFLGFSLHGILSSNLEHVLYKLVWLVKCIKVGSKHRFICRRLKQQHSKIQTENKPTNPYIHTLMLINGDEEKIMDKQRKETRRLNDICRHYECHLIYIYMHMVWRSCLIAIKFLAWWEFYWNLMMI